MKVIKVLENQLLVRRGYKVKKAISSADYNALDESALENTVVDSKDNFGDPDHYIFEPKKDTPQLTPEEIDRLILLDASDKINGIYEHTKTIKNIVLTCFILGLVSAGIFLLTLIM